MIPLFWCQWVSKAGGGVTIDLYGMTIVDFKKIGYKDEPFVLAKDVAQVFYVKDMSSKPRKNSFKSDDFLPGKRKIIGVEDISDKSEDFDQFDDRPPFSVDVDPKHLVSQRGRSLFTSRSQPRDVRQKENCKCSIK